MSMTKKDLLKLLEPYSDETTILVNCKHCNHGESGNDIIKVDDRTNQTFGYIELSINHTWGEL